MFNIIFELWHVCDLIHCTQIVWLFCWQMNHSFSTMHINVAHCQLRKQGAVLWRKLKQAFVTLYVCWLNIVNKHIRIITTLQTVIN